MGLTEVVEAEIGEGGRPSAKGKREGRLLLLERSCSEGDVKVRSTLGSSFKRGTPEKGGGAGPHDYRRVRGKEDHGWLPNEE